MPDRLTSNHRFPAVAIVAGAAMLMGGPAADAAGGAGSIGVRTQTVGAAAPAPVALCKLPPLASKMPPGSLRGLAHHLRQYPTLSLATPRERLGARRLLATIRLAARRWRDPVQASAAGFDTREATRRAGDGSVHYLHAEHRRHSHDGRYLDPGRPESLIYANAPGRRLTLVGVMFSMPRARRGPTPGGPIARWHAHLVCVRGEKRGLRPRRDGSCPQGAKRRQGSEMLHVWFTGDLRSAYGIHAPEPELCRRGLLPAGRCRNTQSGQGM